MSGQAVDNTSDEYATQPGAATIDLTAEIRVDPREGEGSSVPDRIEFYKEGDGGLQYIGDGTLLAGTNPTQYQLSYSAGSHGSVGDVMTYFVNCVGRSVQDDTKEVLSYSRPVRVRRM